MPELGLLALSFIIVSLHLSSRNMRIEKSLPVSHPVPLANF
jgi:hypothetical protein